MLCTVYYIFEKKTSNSEFAKNKSAKCALSYLFAQKIISSFSGRL